MYPSYPQNFSVTLILPSKNEGNVRVTHPKMRVTLPKMRVILMLKK